MKFLTKTILILLTLYLALQAGTASAATISRPMHNAGLVGYWAFDEGAELTAYDRSGNSNDGTLNNMDDFDWVSGQHGGALDFDGTDDYVTADHSSSLNLTGDLSMSAWIRRDNPQVDHGSVISKGNANDNGQQYYMQVLSTGQLVSVIGNAPTNGVYLNHSSTANVGTGIWTHIVMTLNGDSSSIYIDGSLDSTGTGSGSRQTNTDVIEIGRRGDASFKFRGPLDEVRIYNRALSADEVRRLFNLGRPKVGTAFMSDGLVAYYDFNIGKGGIDVFDRSGNGNHGTTSNMDDFDWVTSKTGLGQALDFDGTNDEVRIDDPSNLMDPFRAGGTGVFTASMWIKRDTTGNYDELLHKGNTSNAGWLFIIDQTDADQFEMVFLGVQTYTFNKTLTDTSSWHHVVFTYDLSNNANLYFDGEFQQTIAGSDANVATQDFSIGTRVGGFTRHFDGQLDEVRIYNRALSADEVRRLYNHTQPYVNKTNKGRLTNGLVGHWTFDGPDMFPNVLDVSGQGNHGDIVGQTSTTTAIGKIGQALDFDGVDDYVNVQDNASLDMGTSDWTVSAWFKVPTVPSTNNILMKRDATPTTNPGYQLQVQSDGFIWQYFGDGSASRISKSTSPDRYDDNEWHHVAVTYDRDVNVTIYVDYINSYSANISTQQGDASEGNDLSIGTNQALTNFFDGPIDEVRIYDRALLPQEINALYQMGR